MGKFSNAALRLTAGALILDAGVKKLKADEGTYAFLQQMAATGVPAVSKLDAATFGKLISGAETALGATLLTPFIPARLAGAGLTAFAANLMTMYFRNPDMHDRVLPPHPGRSAARKQLRAARRRSSIAGLQEVSPTTLTHSNNLTKVRREQYSFPPHFCMHTEFSCFSDRHAPS